MSNPAVETCQRINISLCIKNLLSLSKVHLSLFVAFSSYFGFLLSNLFPEKVGFISALGVFFLSCACSTLNNIQDRHVDAQHKRTCHRPFPQKTVKLKYAWGQFFCLTTAAFSLLIIAVETPIPILIGLLSMILYNGCYTPLKKRTLFALVPGTLCGMLPPLIGWTAGGGQQPVLTILIVMMIFGLWQIPHTWLILLRHFGDASGKALPGFSDYFSRNALKRILFVWVTSFSVLLVLLASSNTILMSISRLIITINAVGLISGFFIALFLKKETCYKGLFIHLNLSLLLLMLPVFCERLLIAG